MWKLDEMAQLCICITFRKRKKKWTIANRYSICIKMQRTEYYCLHIQQAQGDKATFNSRQDKHPWRPFVAWHRLLFTWKQAGCECPQAPGLFLAEIHNTGHCWRYSTGGGHSGVNAAPWNSSPHFPGQPAAPFCCHKYGPEPHPPSLNQYSSPAAYWLFHLWKTIVTKKEDGMENRWWGKWSSKAFN